MPRQAILAEIACCSWIWILPCIYWLLLMSEVFQIIQTIVKVFLVFSKLAFIRVWLYWLDLYIGRLQIRLAQTVDTLGNVKDFHAWFTSDKKSHERESGAGPKVDFTAKCINLCTQAMQRSQCSGLTQTADMIMIMSLITGHLYSVLCAGTVYQWPFLLKL